MVLRSLIRGRAEHVAVAVPAVPAVVPSAPEPGGRLDTADCAVLIHHAFEAVAANYVESALALLDTDPDLCRRFHDTEAAIDRAVKAGPTEAELRAALAAHVAVIDEACQRKRAQREAVADTMPERSDAAGLARGVSDGDGHLDGGPACGGKR